MYTAFYGLREKPFALSPNPRYLYLAESHREALAHLLYGLEQGEGFIVISGEVGTGKTTICRSLLERLGGESEVAFLFNPSRNANELLQSINEELGLPADGLSRREILSRLNHFLLEKKRESRRVILIIDEAQNLSPSTLEQVRLLSNLETASSKLIQIILLGQPELDEKLDSDELRQLRQRISVRWCLEPLPQPDTFAYVCHRLRVAAGAEREVFADAALREIHRRTGGVPRLINLLCDRVLLAGYAAQAHRIGPTLVRQAAAELPAMTARGAEPRGVRRRPFVTAAAAAAVMFALFWFGWLSGADLPAGLAGPAQQSAAPGASVSDVASPPPSMASQADSARASAASARLSETDQTFEPSPLKGEEIWLGLPGGGADVMGARLVTGDGGFLAKLLAGFDYTTSATSAVVALLEPYGHSAAGADPRSADEARAQLIAAGMAVMSFERTSFEQLRDLDYPALIELDAADGQLRLVALVRLESEIAELAGIAGHGSLRVPLAALEQRWNGSADVVWRPFEPIPPILGRGDPGDRGDAVLWLQRALGRLGHLDGPVSGVYDEDTREGVRRFQRSRRLEPDGVAGPLTQMALYAELGSYSPPQLSDGEAG